MKRTLVALAVVALATPAFASLPGRNGEHRSDTAIRQSQSSEEFQIARRGCGSKGGPGYRKSNGKCASWKG